MKFFSNFKQGNNKKPSSIDGNVVAVNKKRKKDISAIIFCLTVFIYPVLQWLLVYLYCNIESLLQAFQWYDASDGSFHFFKIKEIFFNFERIFKDLRESMNGANVGAYIRNGAIFYITGLIILTPVNQFCAFAITKKMPLYKTMKLLLFLPNILSTMVMMLLLRYFIERGIPAWLEPLGINFPRNALTAPEYSIQAVLCLNLFLGFGGSIIINTATMGRVPIELVEAGRIDGLKYAGEYWHIYLPIIYPVMTISMLSLFIGFIKYQGPLFSLYGYQTPEKVKTLGYYLYMLQLNASRATNSSGEAAKYAYGYTAAWNLMIGLISIPIVYATKWMFDRIDPNRE